MSGREKIDHMIIEVFESGPMNNNTYLIVCAKTREALVIDPAGDVDSLIRRANSEGYHIRIIVNTHSHYDHTDGNESMRNSTGAELVMHPQAAGRYGKADRTVDDMETIRVGDLEISVIHTPGHTPGGICLYVKGQLFTGDTLFVGDSGRTDLPGGHRPTLGASIRRLMKLPGDTVIRPGHNIGPRPFSTLDREKCHNVNAKEYGYYDELACE